LGQDEFGKTEKHPSTDMVVEYVDLSWTYQCESKTRGTGDWITKRVPTWGERSCIRVHPAAIE
jgi:hypothetical protein